MNSSALDIVAETDDAIAFRVNGKTSEGGRSAVVYFNPLLSRSESAELLRSVASEMDTTPEVVTA